MGGKKTSSASSISRTQATVTETIVIIPDDSFLQSNKYILSYTNLNTPTEKKPPDESKLGEILANPNEMSEFGLSFPQSPPVPSPVLLVGLPRTSSYPL